MNVIETSALTKDYGGGKGVFDVTFAVKKGEVMGFLGPNGAGKTTTIRQLMGFIRPDSGAAHIAGLPCFEKAAQIQQSVGYLPGEIAFMDDMTGDGFIRFVAAMKGVRDLTRARELTRCFALDASGRIKKMSKGMKQKIGIVCAFLQDAEVLILDEPTSGLDPLMQSRFVSLLQSERQRSKTILMSSHIFEEVEKTCSRAAILRAGRIVAVEDMEKLRRARKKTFEAVLDTPAAAAALAAATGGTAAECTATATVADVNAFVRVLSGYAVRDLTVHSQNLESLFMDYYGGDAQ